MNTAKGFLEGIVPVFIEYSYTPEIIATHDNPAEPDELEIESVWIDIKDSLNEEAMALMEQYCREDMAEEELQAEISQRGLEG